MNKLLFHSSQLPKINYYLTIFQILDCKPTASRRFGYTEGQLLKIFGYPSEIGNTSITIYIEARAHNVRTGKQLTVLKTNMKFVYIDEDGNPIPIKDKARTRIEKMIGELK